MRFTSAVLVFLVLGASQASWMKDVVSPEGLKFGTGFVAKLQDNGNVNGSFLERVALKVDYGEIGVSVARNAEINDVEMSFYTNDVSEGRGGGKKDNTLSFLMGFKGAALVTAILAGMKLLVLKALLVAKVALVASASLLIKKLLHHEEHSHYEIEPHESQHYPVFAEYPQHQNAGGGNYEYQPSASQQYFAYNNHYAPSALAESQVQFQTVEAAQGNGTAAIGQETPVKRKDMIRKKQKITVAPTILTIRRYHLDK